MNTVRVKLACALVATAAGLSASGAAAQLAAPAATCGSFYTVQRGDTLFRIAERAYGDGWAFRRVLAANAPALSRPEDLESGELVLLPCLDGTGPGTRAEAIAAVTSTLADPAPAERGAPLLPQRGSADAATASGVHPDLAMVIRIRRNAQPLAGANLPEGGLMPELVARALARSPEAAPFEMVFETEADSSLEGEVLHFPVLMPDCAAAGDPCASAVFSDPVAQITTRFFARRDLRLAAARHGEDLRGLRLCRPAGAIADDLAAAGLTGSGAKLLDAESFAACIGLVASGDADVASFSTDGADEGLRVLARLSGLDELAGIAATHTVHVAGRGDDPAAVAMIDALNAGLQTLRRSDEWSEVVRLHRTTLPNAGL